MAQKGQLEAQIVRQADFISNSNYQSTAEPAYSRLQGSKEFCLLKQKFTITVGLRFCAKNRHGAPTSGFFHTFFLTLRKRKWLHLELWSSAKFFKLTGRDSWRWFFIKNRIMISKFEKIHQELKRNQKTLNSCTTLRGI